MTSGGGVRVHARGIIAVNNAPTVPDQTSSDMSPDVIATAIWSSSRQEQTSQSIRNAWTGPGTPISGGTSGRDATSIDSGTRRPLSVASSLGVTSTSAGQYTQ